VELTENPSGAEVKIRRWSFDCAGLAAAAANIATRILMVKVGYRF
jgi:hypothetical protein